MADYNRQLENLVLWVNDYCTERCAQPFRIHKITSDDGTAKYVAFVLVSELPAEPKRYCVYNLLGFVSVPEAYWGCYWVRDRWLPAGKIS